MQQTDFIQELRHFNRFNLNLIERFNKELYGKIFTLLESDIVTEILENKTITANDITKNTGIDKGQLSNVLKRLETNGIIERVVNPADKRSNLLQLTEKGLEKHTRQSEIVNAGLEVETARFSDTEREHLAQLMTQYENTYKQTRKVAIRQGTPRDLGFITDLHSRVYDDMDFTLAAQYYFFKYVGEYAQDNMNGITWIAEVDGVRVGTMSLLPDDEKTWKIRWVVVDTAYQGLGIGSKLFDTLMAYVKEHQIKNVFLWTIDILKPARHLYGKAGFVMTETKKNTEWKKEPIVEEKWEYHA